ncbi:MAG: hypothetical protein ACPGXY_00195 [Alphaproteobacteria bacterium]
MRYIFFAIFFSTFSTLVYAQCEVRDTERFNKQIQELNQKRDLLSDDLKKKYDRKIAKIKKDIKFAEKIGRMAPNTRSEGLCNAVTQNISEDLSTIAQLITKRDVLEAVDDQKNIYMVSKQVQGNIYSLRELCPKLRKLPEDQYKVVAENAIVEKYLGFCKNMQM